VHESSTISGVWPLSPCYSNLVLFDPAKAHESAETVIPELAERWSWQDNYRNLVFFLRKNVRWHDYSNIGNVIDHAPQWWIERIAQGYAAVGREPG